jgi:carbonic anhydrase
MELLERYNTFHKKHFKDDKTLYNELLNFGQHPKYLVISCSDSRVDPAILFNAKPGELFVVRNIANWVPAYETLTDPCSVAAALSFSVCHLNVEHIVILGHSHCAGVKTLDNPLNIERKVLEWTSIINKETDAEHTNVQNVTINSWKNLFTYPWIAEKAQKKLLHCHAWCFCLESGKLEIFDSSKNSFT